jgi:hypothetical protein
VSFIESVGDDLLHVVTTCGKLISDHFVAWRLHCTLINLYETIIFIWSEIW